MRTAVTQDDRRALQRLTRWHDGEHGAAPDEPVGRDEALLALRELRLLRGLVDEAESEAVITARQAGATWPEVAGMYGASLESVYQRWRDGDDRMGRVWSRIVDHQGEVFTPERGRSFSYRVSGQYLVLDGVNWVISRADIEAALDLVPLRDTAPIQHMTAPTFIHAILMDDRIRGADW